MVKACAYGHGVEIALSALTEADAFGVACLSEALEIQPLIQTHQRIVLMEGAFSQAEWSNLCELPFEAVIHSSAQLEWALEGANCGARPKVWLKSTPA